MEKSHPRSAATVWPAGTTEEERRRAQGDEALHQILLMNGMTAYRRGGWEDWKASKPRYVGGRKWKGRVYAEKGDEMRGFRARVLAHGWVYCRWGRGRNFTEGRRDDRVEVHGVANWREPGFVEFREVVEGRVEVEGRRKGKGKRPMEGEARYL